VKALYPLLLLAFSVSASDPDINDDGRVTVVDFLMLRSCMNMVVPVIGVVTVTPPQTNTDGTPYLDHGHYTWTLDGQTYTTIAPLFPLPDGLQGKYTISVRAVDSSGNHSGPVSTEFCA